MNIIIGGGREERRRAGRHAVNCALSLAVSARYSGGGRGGGGVDVGDALAVEAEAAVDGVPLADGL